MVARRTPNSRWRNKVSTFGMIVFAGTVHRFKHLFDKYLNMNHIQKLAEKDSPFLPENLKVLYEKNKNIIEQQLKYNDPFLKQFKEQQEKERRQIEIMNKIKTYEMTQKHYVLNKFLRF